MKRTRIIALLLGLSLMMLFSSCVTDKDLVRTIEVSGTSSITLAPDIATFSIQVSEKGETTSEAQQLANTKLAQLLEVIKSYGVGEDDIKTTSLNLRPSYKWIDGQQILEGQTASQSLTVTVRNLDSLGLMIDQMGKVTGIYLNSVQMDRENKDEALSQARAQAIADAYAKALLYAQSTSMHVGKPVSISENSVSASVYTARLKSEATMALAYDMPTELPSGTMEVSATITVVYEMY